MQICKETIKKRKAIYGNNFPEIAALQSEYLGYEITPQQVAYSLSILKRVRIDFIKKRLLELRESKEFHTPVVLVEVKGLSEGLEDSMKDYHNYIWISENYPEYEAL